MSQGFGMGRYVPPELEGVKSFNQASGKGHALGVRARKLKTEGVLVVRFECPFAIWCTNCQPEQIIGQGVRFNAEKKKVGNYYSTPIWSFRFKHTVCGKPIEVRTDPQNTEYVVVEGGRQRDTGADKILDGEIRIGATDEEKQKLEKEGGFALLERKLDDRREADTQQKRIDELTKQSDRDWSDPYAMSRKLRREFRIGRRQRQADEKSGLQLQERFGLGFDLLAPEGDDAERAKLIDYQRAKDTGGPSSSVSFKPLFGKTSSATGTRTSEKDLGRGSKVTEAVTVTHKMALTNTIHGNTRSGVDPFLKNDEPWQPQPKRQRVMEARTSKVDGSDGQVVTGATGLKESLVNYESDY